VKAREAKTNEGMTVNYRDVLEDAQALEDMLRFSRGVRKVPVLVEGGQVTIGFGGA
jgi:glutaredoxin